MKNTIKTTLMIATLVFSSCGSSISSDAQKIANLQCKAQELQQNGLTGDESSLEETQELIAESAALIQEMNAKYNSFEEKQEFAQALSKAKANCN